MKSRNILFTLFIFILSFYFIYLVQGAFIFEDVKRLPANGTQEGSVLINFSWNVSITGQNLLPGNAVLCSVQNSSNNLSGPKSELFDAITVINNTQAHKVVTMNNRDDVFWLVSCSNGTTSTGIGANFTVLSGNFTFSITNSFVTTQINPPDNSILTSRFVNHSWSFTSLNINLSDVNSTNCTVIRNGTKIINLFNTTNSTETNVTVITKNGHYSVITNCSTTVGEEFVSVASATEYTVAELVPDNFLFELLKPDIYNAFNETLVNYSFKVNLTGGVIEPNDNITCDLLTRNGSLNIFTPIRSIVIKNSSFFNETITTAEGRTGWQWNCTTDFQDFPPSSLSTKRFFDIDSNQSILVFGAARLIRFNLLTGNITRFSPDGAEWECGITNAGTHLCVAK